MTWVNSAIDLFTCIQQFSDKTPSAAQRLLSHCTLAYWSLTFSKEHVLLKPNRSSHSEHRFLQIFPWRLFSSSLCRLGASSEASSPQPTNNTRTQALLLLIPLWLERNANSRRYTACPHCLKRIVEGFFWDVLLCLEEKPAQTIVRMMLVYAPCISWCTNIAVLVDYLSFADAAGIPVCSPERSSLLENQKFYLKL